MRATETRDRSGADVMRAAARMAAVIRRRERGVRTARYGRLRPQWGGVPLPRRAEARDEGWQGAPCLAKANEEKMNDETTNDEKTNDDTTRRREGKVNGMQGKGYE